MGALFLLVMSLTQLSVADEGSVREALDQLRLSESPVNWVLFGYKSRDTLELLNAGDGGLRELKTHLQETDIRFAVLECVVNDGDQYNSVKNLLITWIGSKVPPGLAKAKAAGHRKELVNFLTESLAIAAEYQAENQSELNSKDMSAALTKRAATYQDSISTGEKKDKLQALSRSHASNGDRKKSQLNIIDEDKITEALKQVYAEEKSWVHITYVDGKKDEVYFKGVGDGGLESLKKELSDDRISFCVCTFKVVETTNIITKFVLLTWVPETINPLAKARSGSHRSELADWIITILPFHSHYQANNWDDLTEEGVLFKLRS